MSKNQSQAATKAEESAAQGASELAEIRGFIRDLTMLVLPPQLRATCGCGRIPNRTVTLVHPKKVAEYRPLCDRCEPPEGYTAVGSVHADGHLSVSVRLANKILDAGR